MSRNRKKDTPYPKKFRMKLEQVAAKKEARENGPPQDALEKVSNVLAHELLTPGSVHLMHGVIDEDIRRLTMKYWLEPPETLDYVTPPPPWLAKPETQASS